jgi:hypothetical protein
MAKGAVTSATIIANGPTADLALRAARSLPQHSFGVHLNITAFAPLSDPAGLAPLLDENGMFRTDAIRQVALTSTLVGNIKCEFDRQVARVRDSGIPLSHLDSHHHVHTIPGLFFALKAVQKKHQIERVRVTRNLYQGRQGVAQRMKKALWNAALRRIGRTRTTTFFTDLTTFIRVANRINRTTTAELMVHPGNPEFAEEDSLLNTDWWTGLSAEIELIDYRRV